jgi:hypothetical protein
MGVNITEYVISLNPESGYSREELIRLLHESLEDIPGVEVEIVVQVGGKVRGHVTVPADVASRSGREGPDRDADRGRARQPARPPPSPGHPSP